MQTDLEQRQAMQTDLGVHMSASLQRSVAKDGAPGSAEPGVGPLAQIFHVEASHLFPMLIMHACTYFTGHNRLNEGYKYERRSPNRDKLQVTHSQVSLLL